MRYVGEMTPVGKIISEVRKFDHQFFSVIERIVETPDGIIRDPQLLWDRGKKQFAVVVAIDTEGRYVLVEEPKYGQMCIMISTPTGGIEKGEKPLDAAKRELLEETGYVSDKWITPNISPITEFADKTDGGEHLFFYALGARKHTEAGTNQKTITVDRSEIMTSLIPNGVVPAMSIAALLLIPELVKI